MTNLDAPADRVLIALGSNLDQPAKQIERALALLAQQPGIRVAAVSRLYRTPPWGVIEQPAFINAAARLDTALDPLAVLDALLAVEQHMGRRREQRWGPRHIDLDLLLYGDQHIDHARLQLPHPQLHRRAFVLVPLLDLEPDLIIPEHGRASDLLVALDCEGIQALGCDSPQPTPH